MASKKKVSPTRSKTKTAPQRERVKKSAKQFVVGIGSSAGGLEALRSLFSKLVIRTDMTYIVVQHLAPNHRSRMVEILAHSTKMKVLDVTDGLSPKSGSIYVTPPNADVFFEDGVLRLVVPHQKIGPKPSVDYFFQSLAANFGERSIGIILSGTGTDGAIGIRAIKEAGGLTISQEITSAKYDGMPRSANLTGQVDLLLPPEEIALELEKYSGTIEHKGPKQKNDIYEQILLQVNELKGSCFNQYKQSTVRRRIDRRMVATRTHNPKAYLEFLKENPKEAHNLFQDILISVTSFFRDEDAYEALRGLMTERVRHKKDGSIFRCWVIGCATGEEAYSIAILFFEVLRELGKELQLQLFATDLDDNALSIARKGIYTSLNLEKVPEELRKRYFLSTQDKFQIKTFVRESIVFARQNVTEDPPFLNTDLISCRNVLIYFNQTLQLKVFQTVRYSLDRDGILFLGKSESIPREYAKVFRIADKVEKLYISVEGKGQRPAFSNKIPLEASFSPPVATKSNEEKSTTGDAYLSLIEAFSPDSVLIDGAQNVKHIYGDLSGILSFPKGRASFLLNKLLLPNLALEVATLLLKVKKSEGSSRGVVHEVKIGKKIERIQVVVTALKNQPNSDFLVTFLRKINETSKPGKKISVSQSRADTLAQELEATQNHLQALEEQNATNTQELQAVNEELQSTNEELQSSNEELETTNEELQSSNEELTTLNQELNVKTTEVQLLYQRDQAVQNAIGYPMLTLDNELNILNLNPAARFFLRLGESDIGSNLRTTAAAVELGSVIGGVEKAFRSRSDNKTQFELHERTFEIQTQLFHNDEGEVQGVVVSFIENTEIVKALSEMRLVKSRLSSIIDNTPALVTIKDLSGVYTFSNTRFAEILGKTIGDIIGYTDEEIFPPDLAHSLRRRDLECMNSTAPVEFDQTIDFDGTGRQWHLTKFLLLDQKKRPYSICTMCYDISDRAEREKELRVFRKSVATAANGTVMAEEINGATKITFCSEAFVRRLGLDYRDLVGLSLEEFIFLLGNHSEEAEARNYAQEMMDSREKVSFTLQRISKEKAGFTTIEIQSIRTDVDGENRQVAINLSDVTQTITDQKTILSQQEDLIRFGRFSTIGEIAAGISHEINTPLNVITTKTDLLRKSIELGKLNPEVVKKVSVDISSMVKNISNIVLGLKAATGVQKDKFEVIELHKVIQDAVKICDFKAQRAGVIIKAPAISSDIKINCYPVQIMQIFINLMNNSIEAVADLPKRWIEIYVIRPSEDMVYIQFKDSGAGIPPQLAEKIMSPFFTTKKEQNGTGIGLSLSRTIAINHGGDLTLDKDSANTSFILRLPTSTKEKAWD